MSKDPPAGRAGYTDVNQSNPRCQSVKSVVEQKKPPAPASPDASRGGGQMHMERNQIVNCQFTIELAWVSLGASTSNSGHKQHRKSGHHRAQRNTKFAVGWGHRFLLVCRAPTQASQMSHQDPGSKHFKKLSIAPAVTTGIVRIYS
jgi:hypothetical protein